MQASVGKLYDLHGIFVVDVREPQTIAAWVFVIGTMGMIFIFTPIKKRKENQIVQHPQQGASMHLPRLFL